MQTQSTLVSVAEYLTTSFDDGDREYVDGVIVERNLGEKTHSKLQRKLIVFLESRSVPCKRIAFPNSAFR